MGPIIGCYSSGKRELEAKGKKVYVVPYGGSNLLGAYGFVDAVKELKEQLNEMNLKIDYIFLDGGHDYETVKNDLNCSIEVINNNGTILCDDYDLSYAPGVKKAIDEFSLVNKFNCSIICNNRFAKIEKN